MENKRIQYIDVAKFLAMLLVVFSHGFKESLCTAFIFSFHIPTFFVLNGMTLNLEQDFGSFLVKRLKGYIVPMLGLGVLSILLDHLLKWILNTPSTPLDLLINLSKVINQSRYLALWFLSALFFSDLLIYGFHKFFHKNVILMGMACLAAMTLGILFNQYYNTTLVWNLDAAFFGCLFVYFGYIFGKTRFAQFQEKLMKNRWLPLIVGTVLLTATFFFAKYIFETDHMHLEMFARKFGRYYLTLPCGLIGAIGFTCFCRGITCSPLARLVEINLLLLPLHQVMTFRVFRFLIAKSWWTRTYYYPATSPDYIAFVLTMVLFSVVVAGIMHLAIKYSPFSFIVNRPIPDFYKRSIPNPFQRNTQNKQD